MRRVGVEEAATVGAELLDRLLGGERPAGDLLFGDRRGRVAGIERGLVDGDGDHAVTEVLDDALGDQYDREHEAEWQQDAQQRPHQVDPEVAEQRVIRCG